MPKVSLSLGVNIPLTEENRFDRFTPSVGISEIDTDGDVDKQIEISLEVTEKCWAKISDLLVKKIKEESDRLISIPK